MIIYNVTVQMEPDIAEQWLGWMQQLHIPQVMATGCFTRYQLVRLLETQPDEGTTYAIQYYAEGRPQVDEYLATHAPALRKEVEQTWGNKVFAFRTLMEVI
ncbi:MAG TPA: DUF4286 family protein [Phnomibacter sp.]|nr:DUF4286 family protein [Phnomibacter sp.]